MYVYTDSNDVAPGKSGGRFGLNTGAFITKFEYNSNAGKEGAAADALDLTVQIGEKEFRHRFFPVTKVFGKNGEITDTNSQEYKDEHKKVLDVFSAVLSDVVKCFVDVETLKAALATPISTFKVYAEILQRLVQSTPNWQKQPVDVFLQYQYKPSGSNDKTYLELPNYSKTYHGLFITKSLGQGFIEDKTPTHLRYATAEGLEHPFKRGEWFMGSDFAKQTVVGGATPTGAPAMSTVGETAW